MRFNFTIDKEISVVSCLQPEAYHNENKGFLLFICRHNRSINKKERINGHIRQKKRGFIAVMSTDS
jgi:hypothetical protein